ncbi:MAG: Gfo/Idh/MocA family oxidoreductase [Pseudomonadota bacterium]
MTQELGIALIGSGYMGKAHALAYHTMKPVFGDTPDVRLEVLCDTPEDRANAMAEQFGFARATTDYREAVADPRVDVVSIATPNKLHKEMVLASAAAGKHVWVEKPLGITLEEGREMVAAVAAAGIQSMVGYNYVRNPAFQHARKLITDGAIGRIIHFRGVFEEDYSADPDLPWSWRSLTSEAGLGALGDMACHLISLTYELVGPIDSLVADMQTVYETRPMPDGSGRGPVENEDIASALVRFANGAHGVLLSSRVAWGRKNKIAFEVHGDKGMICFDQERMNELQIYRNAGPRAEQGFATILTGPEHPPYGHFIPGPGHSLGFMDLKTIEAAEFLRTIAYGTPSGPDIKQAFEYERVIFAIAEAAATQQRVSLTP